MKRFAAAALACILSVYAAAAQTQAAEQLPANVTFWSSYPADELAETIVDRMTDEELFSQIFMFGWAGAEPDELLYQWVQRGLGSVKVFGWNTDDIVLVAKSISSLQKSAARNRFGSMPRDRAISTADVMVAFVVICKLP